MALEIEVLPDARAVAQRGAEIFASAAAAAIAERGLVHVRRLRRADALGDVRRPRREAAVGEGHDLPGRRAHRARTATPTATSRSSSGAFRREVRPTCARCLSGPRISRRQRRCTRQRCPSSSISCTSGLGPDGHTASLVPGDPVLDVSDRDVAVTGVYQGRRRMTLTYPVLNRARQILWLVTGEDKVDALARLRAGDPSIPAGRVSTANALVVADAAAAGSTA